MSLESDIRDISANSGAEMAVSALHLETGQHIDVDAERVYPLCSVLKIPVLVEAFRQIEDGLFTLDDRWQLTTAEKNLPSGILVFFDDGLAPTVKDLLTLMIIISDNTATDMVMHRLGQGSVTRTMHDLGLTDIHVPLTIRELFDDLLPSSDPTQDMLALARGPRNRTGISYSLGPDNDTGTPAALTELLARIWRGEAVNRAACDAMLEILLKQQLNDRLPRYLPPGTPCAHKTGTLPGIRNDSGIIYAGDNSHVAVTVFSRWDDEAVSDDPIASKEQPIAIDAAFGRIGRLLYDTFSES
ncbi:MAG: serine hydrolase [Caldilineaceae bacterium SB0675_bin_29]|uniref:Serine hydrolase n=1 Tax=Caldilineaceae bacterium SB0675_bin_29 TaxID=2605266 RepID=A0A6B1G2L9_9CHLR|nr:serine hydrolase [Caldilineaceae bacterium SB0675_bin_29]